MTELNSLLGYYDSPDQPRDKPAYDPGFDVVCPICYRQLEENDMRTISFCSAYYPSRSYFYRTHKSCHVALSDEEQEKLDNFFIDNLTESQL